MDRQQDIDNPISGSHNRSIQGKKEKNDFIANLREKMVEQTKLIKLELLLLNYIFMEDDGKISGKEKRNIKKHFSKYKSQLYQKDIEEIESFDDIGNSIGDITRFIEHNDYDSATLSKALISTKKICNNDRYSSIFNRVTTNFINYM